MTIWHFGQCNCNAPLDGELVQASNPVMRRRQLAAELRRLREASGHSLDEAAEFVGCSKAKMSRIENARVTARLADVRSLLDLYDVSSNERELLLRLVDESRRSAWWTEYADVMPEGMETFYGLSDEARTIQWYGSYFVPGILQTRDYIYALAISRPDVNDQADRIADFRMASQRILTAENAPSVIVVIDEPALRRPIGGRATMGKQLAHLAHVAALPNLTIQIIPLITDVTGNGGNPFTVFTFDGDSNPKIVYIPGIVGGTYESRASEVNRCQMIFESLRSGALSPEDSLTFIEELLQELRQTGASGNDSAR